METSILDGILLKKLILNGYQSLSDDYQRINSLNVFPVPDGDTGTNMKKTMEGGANAISHSKESNIGSLAKDMARGMTFSARGNSGVILSQFFKGLANGLEGKATVDVAFFADAMLMGVSQAYKVVNNPTEGTILTVMRESAQAAHDANCTTLEGYFKELIKEANESLKRTPDLLPVLKKAGVIDSGGAGFIKILEGMALALDGEMLVALQNETEEQKENTNTANLFNADSELEFGYCTEFILQLQNKKVDIPNFDLKQITDYLETKGNSIVAFKDEDIVKVHVHTFVPGEIINYCQQFGEYVTFKMENMSVQHSEVMAEEVQEETMEYKDIAYIAVSNAPGISDLFKEMGVDYVVQGGQTMNPSTNDFIAAFEKINADTIFVFPNNHNIIMAAEQAANNYDKAKVIVVKTANVAECFAALSMIEPTNDVNALLEGFEASIDNVETIEVTYAIRNSQMNDFMIEEGDYLGFNGHNLVSVDKSKIEATVHAFEKIKDIDCKEVVTILFGKDVLAEELALLTDQLTEKYPWMEIGSIDGGQDIYSFIIAIE